MGKPGGFFKRLHSKQKRQASRQRRGTKGASKEERQRKRQEQAAYFAAKREAEQLAAVSSSSDDDEVASTDSDEVRDKRLRGIKKLHSVLGVRSSTSKRHRKHGKQPAEDEETPLVFSDDDDTDDKVEVQKDLKGKKNVQHGTEEEENGGVDTDLLEEPEEDWRNIIGDEEEEEELEEEDEEDVDDLLMDLGEDDEEEEERTVENPLLALEEDDPADDIFERVIDFDEPVEEGEEGEEEELEDDELLEELEEEELEEEEEEEEEEDREDEYVDEDDELEEDSPATKKKKQNQQKQREEEAIITALLPSFQWGSSSSETLLRSGVVQPDDPWYQKYHLDHQAGQLPLASANIGTTSGSKKLKSISSASGAAPDPAGRLEPLEISPAALDALAHSYEPYMIKAEKDIEIMAMEKQQRLPSFVRKEDYERLKPENIALDANEAGKVTLLHAPFDPLSKVASVSGASHSSSTLEDDRARVTRLEHHAATEKPPYLHPELWKKWKAYREKQQLPVFTVEERGLFDLCQGYADLLDTSREWQKTQSRREVFTLHLLNHWFKARAVIAAHDKMLEELKRRARQRKLKRKKGKKQQKREESDKVGGKRSRNDDEEEEDDDDDEVENYELRDRGFSKTRLLVMLPLRHHAYLYVHTMVSILGADPNDCPKLGTFQQDFTEIEEAIDPTFRRRPRDYQREFEGNIDDSFCVGIKLEPHRLSVYAHPLNSDIILCSPLGLRRRTEKNGDALVSLSSIEVCLVDYGHVLMEQNWAHVAVVLEELLNQRPLDTTRGLSDLRRTYAWALDNRSTSHRQTLLSSDLCVATILNSFRSMQNSWGKLRLYPKQSEGVLHQVKLPVQQHFMRFTPQSLATTDNERLEYFTKHIFAARLNPLAERDVRIIIYVPSYFDFVRLRTFLHREYRETYAAISEYSSLKQQRKALGQFSDLERPVLLVTERFYYFKRYFVSMSEVVVFYSPPLIPSFYLSFVNRLVAQSPNVFTLTLFSRYDAHELVRIVGTQKAQQLLQRESSVYSFMTS